MKSKITILFIIFVSTISLAQTKVGTINSDYLIALMPENKIVAERSQAYGAKLDSLFSIKLNEYDSKLKNYQEKQKELTEENRNVLIAELTKLDSEVKRYQQNGNKLMELKQDELMRPLYKKLMGVINQIAKQDGYTQILKTSGNQFVFIDENFDITKQVMQKLGLKAPEVKK